MSMMSFMRGSPEMERGPSMLLLPFMIIGLAVVGYMVLKPPEQLPISQADGSYENSCCGSLVLRGGRGAYGTDAFDYLIENDKGGAFVLPTHQLVVDHGSRLVIVPDEAPLKLRLETGAKPQWIDIPGVARTYRFVRQR
jgi:hypothetical protein